MDSGLDNLVELVSGDVGEDSLLDFSRTSHFSFSLKS